jgi:hypothetical protein
MLNIKGFRVQDFFLLISDGGNAIASKLITYVGVAVGIGGGAAQAVVTNSNNAFLQECANKSPSWLAYISAVAAISLAMKNIADIYYRRKEFKNKNDEL